MTDTRNAVSIPAHSIISSVEENVLPNSNTLIRLAPNMTGIAKKNVNSAATLLDTPNKIPPSIVAPERLVPGNTAAIT